MLHWREGREGEERGRGERREGEERGRGERERREGEIREGRESNRRGKSFLCGATGTTAFYNLWGCEQQPGKHG